MTYVALAEAVALALVALVFANVIRWLIREHARERDLVLNQLLHLAGRTWQPPPVKDERPVEEPLVYLDPAMLPDDYLQ